MEKIGKLITVVLSPLLTLIIAVYSWNTDKKMHLLEESQKQQEINIKSLDSIAKLQDIKQKDIEFTQKLRFDIYDKVATALESNNAKKQECVVALVKALLTENDDFRNNLLGAFIASKETDASIKTELQKNLVAYNEYKSQESEKQKTADEKIANAGNKQAVDKRWDVDIFYLESNAEQSKPRAEALKNYLDASKYHVRVRVLPELINSKPGYMIANDEIRYDVNNGQSELAEVGAIQKTLAAKGFSFQLRKASNNTPWYISIFII